MGINYVCPECGIDSEAVAEAVGIVSQILESGRTFLAEISPELERVRDLLKGKGLVYFTE